MEDEKTHVSILRDSRRKYTPKVKSLTQKNALCSQYEVVHFLMQYNNFLHFPYLGKLLHMDISTRLLFTLCFLSSNADLPSYYGLESIKSEVTVKLFSIEASKAANLVLMVGHGNTRCEKFLSVFGQKQQQYLHIIVTQHHQEGVMVTVMGLALVL